MGALTAFLDANILYSAGLRDFLLRIAERHLYSPLSQVGTWVIRKGVVNLLIRSAGCTRLSGCATALRPRHGRAVGEWQMRVRRQVGLYDAKGRP